jgi:uncharacterized protein (DUF1499 family)
MARWPVLLAIFLVIAALALFIMSRWPPIHDITTDVDNPPAFVALLPYRTGRVSPPEYDGPDAARQQRAAYPDVRPLIVPLAPAVAFDAALAVARESGWQVAASDPQTGRIEAIATTTLMRFKDDLVIRVMPEGTGARIDMRSKSRVGVGDLGTNARRIVRFMDALRSRLHP